MTIESSSYKLDSSDVGEPTQRVERARCIAPEPEVEEEPTRKLVSVRLIAPDSRTILSTTYDLSVVVLTRNEYANVVPLLESLQNALCGLHAEIIFVDDSDVDTPEVNAAHQPPLGDAALAQAIKDRYFVLVELSFNYQPAQAHFIAQQMAVSGNYDLIDRIPFQNPFGTGYFYLWRSAAVAGHGNFTSLSQVKV